MYKKKLLATLLLFVVICVSSVHSQTKIDFCHNSIRDGEMLTKKQVLFVNPTIEKGMNLWRLPNETITGKDYIITYELIGDTIQTCEHGTCYFRYCSNDSLYLSGYENKTTNIQYHRPCLEFKYPFCYGDSLACDFAGTGIYCDKVRIGIQGQSYTVADQIGEFSNGIDTFRNALRVHVHKDMEQWEINDMDLAPTKQYQHQSGGSKKHISEDHYLWYIEGYRYPVLESIESRTFVNGTEKSFYNTSFLYLPEWQDMDLPFDYENNMLKYTKTLNEASNTTADLKLEGTFPITMTASYDNDSGRIVLDYSQNENGTLKIVVCDAFARPLGSTSYNHNVGSYQQVLQLENTPSSNVIIIYMEINGKKHSIKI